MTSNDQDVSAVSRSPAGNLANVSRGDMLYIEFSLAEERGTHGIKARVDHLTSGVMEDGMTEATTVYLDVEQEHPRFEYFSFRVFVDDVSAPAEVADQIEVRTENGGPMLNRPLDELADVEVLEQ